MIAAVIASDTTPQGIPTDHAFTPGFGVAAGVAVLAVLASLALPPARRRGRRRLEGVAPQGYLNRLQEEPAPAH